MRKFYLSLVSAAAFFGFVANASAFEAMLGGNFALHAHPGGHHHLMVLSAGDIVNVDHCDHNWCAVTHGPHAGYLYMPRVVDGVLYGPKGGTAGAYDDGPAELGLGLVAAPVQAAGQIVDAGVSVLR